MVFRQGNRPSDRDESDYRREPSGPVELAEGESDYDRCECGHIRGRHAGNSRCTVTGCGCQMFRPDA